jgi:5-methyltetrahydrofolate--homocysteine methyltransferase
MSEIDTLSQAIRDLEQDQVLETIDVLLKQGVSPMKIVEQLQSGMTEAGELFAKGEYFLSELIMIGEIMKQAMAKLEPFLAGVDQETKGTIVIGTVRGDVHDLGKNIVVMLLKGSGYKVIDLGVDVPAEKFIEAVKQSGAPLVGMSVLLTACQESMREIIKTIRDAGLKVKILIGGNYVDENVRKYSGADAFGTSADMAVSYAREVFGN